MTRDAIAAKDVAQKLKNVNSAKKTKLRQKAAKDATIDLDPALEQLDKEGRQRPAQALARAVQARRASRPEVKGLREPPEAEGAARHAQ